MTGESDHYRVIDADHETLETQLNILASDGYQWVAPLQTKRGCLVVMRRASMAEAAPANPDKA
jgi:hypothetical protein